MALQATDNSEHIIGISIVLAFLLPHSNTVLLLVNPVLCLLLWILYRGKRVSLLNYFIFVSVLVTILAGLLNSVEMKSVIRAFTILLYLATFPMVGKIKVRNGYIVFCIMFILLSQFATIFSIPYISDFLDKFYPLGEDSGRTYEYMRNNATLTTIVNYRLGGLYHNSNQCSKFASFLLTFYIINNRNKKMSSLVPVILLSSFSILITGSRTGFVVLFVLLFFFMWSRNEISFVRKKIYSVIAITISLTLIILGSNFLRGLNLNGGIEGSLNSKVETLLYYISTEESLLRFLVGYLDSSLYVTPDEIMSSFDSDIGEVLYSYGFIGLSLIFLFYAELFRYMNKNSRLFCIIILWSVSSTIIASYRCSFIFFLLLSLIVSDDECEQDEILIDSPGEQIRCN